MYRCLGSRVSRSCFRRLILALHKISRESSGTFCSHLFGRSSKIRGKERCGKVKLKIIGITSSQLRPSRELKQRRKGRESFPSSDAAQKNFFKERGEKEKQEKKKKKTKKVFLFAILFLFYCTYVFILLLRKKKEKKGERKERKRKKKKKKNILP